MKKMFAALLCAVMIFSVLPAISVSAVDKEDIVSVAVDDVVCYEGLDAIYDNAGVLNVWWTLPEHIVVTLADGETIEGDYGDMQNYFCASDWFPGLVNARQVNENFVVGVNPMKFILFGEEYDYNVVVEEFPLESISASDMTVEEYLRGGWTDSYYDEDGDVRVAEDDFYVYNVFPDAVTLNFKDGHSETYTLNELGSLWRTCGEVDFRQTPDHLMECGNTYRITYSLFGLSCEYDYTIVESSIEGITIEDIEYTENEGGIQSDGYYWYPISPDCVTVHYKDGTSEQLSSAWQVLSGIFGDIPGYGYAEGDRQSAEHPWGAGEEHTITFTVGNYSCEYKIRINPKPLPVLGDVDGNGKLTTHDVALMKRVMAGSAADASYDYDRCDLNGDGKITTKDLSALKRLIAGA